MIFHGTAHYIPWTYEIVYCLFQVCASGSPVKIIGTFADISTRGLAATKQECCTLGYDVRCQYHQWKMIQFTRISTDILQNFAPTFLFQPGVNVRRPQSQNRIE
jgi:hypothetical protein